jgi:hypothetical protein
MDIAIRQLVADALASYPAGSANLVYAWSDEARMWFTEVTPLNPDAAPLSIAFDGADLLSVTVGDTWFEIFPVATPAELDHVREVVEAVFAGQVEESGMRGKEFARITLKSGPISVGSVHMPWPWSGRQARRYQPYAGE